MMRKIMRYNIIDGDAELVYTVMKEVWMPIEAERRRHGGTVFQNPAAAG